MTEIIRFRTSYLEPYPLDVKDEADYRDEIELVVIPNDDGVDQDDFIAHLILEGPEIVRVQIEGHPVGRLRREDAVLYRQRLVELGKGNAVGTCYASIRGGHILRSGEQADYGVLLDLDLSAPLEIIHPVAAPPPIVSPQKPAAAARPILKKKNELTRRIWKIIRWAFAPKRWWKTVLILIFAYFLIRAWFGV